jgi:predicted ATPase/DNA-binding winged helix-turn-helix (wHTH) protein/tetratricopeptide (TPR) repeat protein
VYRFRDVVVDPRAREVSRGGERVALEPQALDLLVLLIERRDEVVRKEALIDAVWGHGFVSESALTTRVKEIRRAVGDDGRTQHTIRNERGRGYRFVAPLEDDPASAAPPPRASIPAGAETLVGRQDELDRLHELMDSAAVVSVVGPGGVGKTALARAVAERVAASGRRTCVVELAPLDRADTLLPALARVADLALDPDRPEHVVAALARLDALVVLDNCEHVVDVASALVERLVTTPGHAVTILVTSQVRLGVSGERVLALEPLAISAAVDLFTERAAAARPDWTPREVEAGRIVGLVESLDRLPLPIEMAAGRLGSMTFDDVERAARDAGRLGRLSHRSPTPRHRTLGSLVEWSAGLLSAEDRRVFTEMAAFAGAVTVEDAAAVLGLRAETSLPELAERSLLAADLSGATTRYRMLETVRSVSTRWLAEGGDERQVRRRHAEWATAALEAVDVALRGRREAWGRQRLAGLVDELRHAHRWARTHDVVLADRLSADLHVATYNRVWSEPSVWAGDLLDAAGDSEPAGPMPGARLLLAGAAANAGDLDRAGRQARLVLAAEPTPSLEAAAHEVLSDVALYAGRFDDVERHASELLAIVDAIGDLHGLALSVVNLSLSRTFQGDPDAGLALLEDLDTAEMSPSNRAWLAYTAGEAHARLGASAAAVGCYREAVDLGAGVGNPFVTSVSHSALAGELRRAGARREAYAAYASGLESAVRHGNVVHAVAMLRDLAVLLHADGEDRAAVVLVSAASDESARPAYGRQAEELAALMGEAGTKTEPDTLAEWVTEGRTLDLDAAARLGLEHARRHGSG